MLLQPDKSDFILIILKKVELHEHRNHCALMTDSEVDHKHKNKYGKLETLLSIWPFKCKLFPYGILVKHKSRLCAYLGMQQQGVN